MFKDLLELLAHKQFKLEEGYITLFGQYGLMTPVLTVVEIQKILEGLGQENALYYGAKKSGIEWIRKIFKKYHMNKIDEQVKWGEKTFTLAGNGKMSVLGWDLEEKTMTYQVHDSAISRIYGKSNHAVDQIPRGWFAGATSVFFQEDMDAVEVKCLAKGDPYCEFVAKPKKKFDFKKPIIRKQLKKI